MSSWIVQPKSNLAARLRLYCFPYAGRGASVFYAWPRNLPADVELCAIQPPGREVRLMETPCHDLAELVEKVVEVLPHSPELPFAFFGHSLGAMVAFEVARKLRRDGRELPRHLFVSGRGAPHIPRRRPAIHHLPEAEFIVELRRLEGTPEEVLQNEAIMELMLPTLRADFAVVESYRYVEEPPLELPITAYGGEADPDVSEADVAAWEGHAAGAFRARSFPGNHFFLDSHRALLLADLARELSPILAHPAGSGRSGNRW